MEVGSVEPRWRSRVEEVEEEEEEQKEREPEVGRRVLSIAIDWLVFFNLLDSYLLFYFVMLLIRGEIGQGRI